MMKFQWELEDFLGHCRKVARFNIDNAFSNEEDPESEETELLQPEIAQVSVEGDPEVTCNVEDSAGDNADIS